MSAGLAPHEDVPIILSVTASFTKSTAQSDYGWRGNAAALPAKVRAVADELTHVPNATAVSLADGGVSWLVLARPLGTDAAGRRFLVVDVCRFVEPVAPSPELSLLTTAQAPLWPHELNRAGHTLHIRPGASEASSALPDDLLRARLGAPLSTSAPVALTIARRPPFRYDGICYMTRAVDGARPTWRPTSPGLLCVNCADPIADADLLSDLEFLKTMQLTPEQWAVLDGLDSVAATRAIRWLRDSPSLQLPYDAPADLQRFAVVTLAKSIERGPRLLDYFLRRWSGGTPSHDAIAAAAGPLGPEELMLLEQMARGGRADRASDALRALARGGFLQWVDTLSMQKWFNEETAGDSEIMDAALARLENARIPAPIARFILDIAPGSHGNPSSIELASVLATNPLPQLPPPRRRFMELLEQAESRADVELLMMVARPYGGALAAIAEVAREALPASTTLAAADVVAALRIHERIEHAPALLRYVGDLLATGRAEEIMPLIDASAGSSLALSPAALGVIRSRLRLGPPVPIRSADAIRDALAEGIVEPTDVVPESIDALRAVARHWRSTSWLSDLFDERPLDEPPATALPPGWHAIVRAALTGRMAARVIEHAAEAARAWLSRWIAEMHDVDPHAWSAFLDGNGALPTRDEAFLAEFLVPLSKDRERGTRLRVLEALASSRLLARKEDLARSCAALVGSDDVAQLDFATYLLSGIGPMPLLGGVPPDLLSLAVPIVPPEELVTALMVLETFPYDTAPELPRRIALRVRETAKPMPAHGYTRHQICRHVPLATALSAEKGWAAMAVDRGTREAMALAYRRQLGLDELETAPNGDTDADSE